MVLRGLLLRREHIVIDQNGIAFEHRIACVSRDFLRGLLRYSSRQESACARTAQVMEEFARKSRLLARRRPRLAEFADTLAVTVKDELDHADSSVFFDAPG